MLLPSRPAAPRLGLSLLEVLVALAIFLLSFVAIGRLVTLATDHALDIQQQSQATRLAQSKLNEVIAGAESLQGGSGSFDEDPSWQWTVATEQSSDVPNLWTVTVTVTHPGGEGGEDVTATLSQMVIDPSIRGSVFDQITVTGSTDTAPSGTGSQSAQSGAAGQTGASGAGGSAASKPATSGSGASKPAAAAGPTKSATPSPAKSPTPSPAKSPTPGPSPNQGKSPAAGKGGASKGG